MYFSKRANKFWHGETPPPIIQCLKENVTLLLMSARSLRLRLERQWYFIWVWKILEWNPFMVYILSQGKNCLLVKPKTMIGWEVISPTRILFMSQHLLSCLHIWPPPMLSKSDMILLANLDRDVCLLFLDQSPMASIHILSSCIVQCRSTAPLIQLRRHHARAIIRPAPSTNCLHNQRSRKQERTWRCNIEGNS